MTSTVARLEKLKLIKPPQFLSMNIMYETIMGSVAYGVSSDTSDMDVYGFCIPPKTELFPHLAGEIEGFGKKKDRFTEWQKHHINDVGSEKVYDLTIYNITKYITLCMDNNPNMIDSLFTPQECVLHITKVGQMVRDKRKMFLHKGSWVKFRGYAYSQLHKMASKTPQNGSNRDKLRKQFGFDVKFAYHVVRLLDEAEQILLEGDIDLRRNREQLKAIRRGDMTEQEIREWASNKEKHLENVYQSSKLPQSPPKAKIKALLMECLEEHYGCLADSVVEPDAAITALKEVQDVLDRNARLLN